MNAVTEQEFVEALRDVVNSLPSAGYKVEKKYFNELADRIKKHGIAPPVGMVLVKAKPVGYTAQSSLDDLAREECSGVIIGSYSERYHRTIPIYAAPEVKP